MGMNPRAYGPTSDDSGQDDWLLTYSDAMTLLLAFFVVLFAISDVDQAKYEEIKAMIVGEVSKKAVPKPFTDLAESLNQIIATSDQAANITIENTRKGVSIEFTGTSLFAPGQATLRPEAEKLLNKIIGAIGMIHSDDYIVEVEGHTDDSPMQSKVYPTNWQLSTARSTNVVRYMIRGGMSADRLKASGFADTRPKVPNRDIYGNPIPEHRARNRRVVIDIKRPS